MSYFAIIMAALALTPLCMGQDTAKVDPGLTAAVIGRVLAKARVSGSLVYQGQCQERGESWDLPAANFPNQHETDPVQMLREMFADDPKMHVVQDNNRNIRMVETDVPRDLLDLRIVQVPFTSEPSIHAPRWAITQIMATPDVKNYMTVNNIGPVEPDFRLFIGPVAPHAPKIRDDLYYVTVSEALDYIVKTYPGFWVYEECKGENGNRKVFFQFFPTVSEGVVRLP